MLAVQILNVSNLFLSAVEKGIEKTDEQVLVHLCTEQLLESEVCIGVDIALTN